MISVVGWGLIVAGILAAREIVRAQQEAEQAAPEPIPVRNEKARRPRQ